MARIALQTDHGHTRGPSGARRLAADVADAAQTYGPVVRIGPNKLAVSNADDIREIYRSHNFLKSSWYDFFTFGGMPNTFCTRSVGPRRHVKVAMVDRCHSGIPYSTRKFGGGAPRHFVGTTFA